jgi:hypothetical protein
MRLTTRNSLHGYQTAKQLGQGGGSLHTWCRNRDVGVETAWGRGVFLQTRAAPPCPQVYSLTGGYLQ